MVRPGRPPDEAGPVLATEGGLLLAQKQVLEEEALAASEDAVQSANEDPEEFNHRGRIIDRHPLQGPARKPAGTTPTTEWNVFRRAHDRVDETAPNRVSSRCEHQAGRVSPATKKAKRGDSASSFRFGFHDRRRRFQGLAPGLEMA